MTSPLEILFLSVVTFLCSILTVVAGAGGGMVLLAVMIQFVPPAIAIPAHGVVQVAANSTRTWLFRHHVAWPLIWRFALLLPPGIAVGLLVFQGLPQHVVKLLIGCFVLVTLFSGRFTATRDKSMPLWAFIPLGFANGVLNMVVGVIGPVIAAFVVRTNIRKEGVVGTMGVFGLMGNFAKIVGFTYAGFSFYEFWPLLVMTVPAAILGMNVGKRLLWRFTEQTFRKLLQSVLVALAAKMIVYDGLGWIWL